MWLNSCIWNVVTWSFQNTVKKFSTKTLRDILVWSHTSSKGAHQEILTKVEKLICRRKDNFTIVVFSCLYVELGNSLWESRIPFTIVGILLPFHWWFVVLWTLCVDAQSLLSRLESRENRFAVETWWRDDANLPLMDLACFWVLT